MVLFRPILKRVVPFVFQGMDETGLHDKETTTKDSHPQYHLYPDTLREVTSNNNGNTQQTSRSPFRQRIQPWIPELNPHRWLGIQLFWCIVYAVPLVALLWRTPTTTNTEMDNHGNHSSSSDTTTTTTTTTTTSVTEFYYSTVFLSVVTIGSCITWVVSAALSTYWFWNVLGYVRAIELVFSLYFVVDAILFVIRHISSTTNNHDNNKSPRSLSTRDILIDYGVDLLAYIWAVDLSIKAIIQKEQDQEAVEANVHQADGME